TAIRPSWPRRLPCPRPGSSRTGSTRSASSSWTRRRATSTGAPAEPSGARRCTGDILGKPKEGQLMRRGIAAAVASTVVLGAIVPTASAAGPVPPLLQGAPGIAVAGGAHVVASPAHGKTRVRLVRDRNGAVLRTRVLAGKLGIPRTTYAGTVEGTW